MAAITPQEGAAARQGGGRQSIRRHGGVGMDRACLSYSDSKSGKRLGLCHTRSHKLGIL
jgi:hypothetical protein